MIFIFSTTAVVWPWSYTGLADKSPGIFCVSWNDPHITNSFQALGVVIGVRNLSNSSNRSRRSISKRTHNERGIVLRHNAGMNRARASRQKELSTKTTNHHWRHRSSVRRSMPRTSRRRCIRWGFKPWCMADTKTTTTPA